MISQDNYEKYKSQTLNSLMSEIDFAYKRIDKYKKILKKKNKKISEMLKLLDRVYDRKNINHRDREILIFEWEDDLHTFLKHHYTNAKPNNKPQT